MLTRKFNPCADNMWLNSAYKACGMTNPVPFWNDICHRTLNWIGGKWLGVTKENVSFKGVKHHAGDDAEHEAQHAIMVMRQLKQALLITPTRLGKTQPEQGITIVSISKQEFILNNITEMVRAGRVEGLPKLAADLAEVYDASLGADALLAAHDQGFERALTSSQTTINNDVPYVPKVENGYSMADVALQASLAVPLTDVPTAPREATEPTPIVDAEIPTAPTAPVADVPTEPTAPAERTHDDWGLPFSDEWNVSTRNTHKNGYFKRKPGTNEEQYAGRKGTVILNQYRYLLCSFY